MEATIASAGPCTDGKAMPLLVPPPSAARANNFNTLRLAMALLVVWSHSFALWFGTEAGEPISRLFDGVYNAGNIGVLTFFTISGFLISLSYQRSPTILSYLGKRVARIHPGYMVATTLCSLVVVPLLSDRLFGYVSADELAGMASNLLLRNYIVPAPGFDGAINGSLWSIPFEFWCYLGVIGLFELGLFRRPILLPLLTLAVMLTRSWLDVTGRRPYGGIIGDIIGMEYFWFKVLPPFLVGATVLAYRDHLPRLKSLAIGLPLVTVLSAWIPLTDNWHGLVTNLLLPPTLGYLIFFVAFHPRIQLGDAARFGDFSYGCYLYAFPVQQLLHAAFRYEGIQAFPLYLGASVAASLIAGVLSWYLVERWFEAKRLRRHRRPLDEESLLAAP